MIFQKFGGSLFKDTLVIKTVQKSASQCEFSMALILNPLGISKKKGAWGNFGMCIKGFPSTFFENSLKNRKYLTLLFHKKSPL